MNDQPTPHSGSRWEPPPTPPGDQPGSQPGADQPGSQADQPDARAAAPAGNQSPVGAAQPVTPGTATPRVRARPFAVRGRAAKVAAATAIVTLGGLGGFALGQAASDGGDQIGLVDSTTDDGRFPGAPPASDDGITPDFHDSDQDHVAPPPYDDDGPGTPPDGFDDDGAESGSGDTT